MTEEKNTSPASDAQTNADSTQTNADTAKQGTKEETKKEEAKQAAPTKAKESLDAARDDSAESKVEIPKEFKKLVEEIEKMSVLQLHELVKVLEKKFGVSAAAIAVAAPGAGGGDAGEEEKTEFNVELKGFGESKIGVIKAVKAVLGLGLKDAKDLVEAAPTVLKENIKKEEAEAIKSAVEEAGGQAELS